MKINASPKSKEKTTIMIAEDHVMMRRALADNIHEHSENYQVIGSAENGKVLLDLIKENQPDIVILDMTMPVMGGNEVLDVLKREYPGIKTIIYSSDYGEFLVAAAVLRGAAAYVAKMTGDISEILFAIEKVCEHGYYFTEVAAQEIILALHKQKKIYYLIENKKISEIEIEILLQICTNKQIKQIAADLKISPGTVKYHKGNLLAKTESEATFDLILYAIRQGIFNPSDNKPKGKS